MLFERIESEGIAHYSYLIGEGTQAAVIDPRRDCEIYIKKAAAGGMRIEAILETHRNEDYVIGSVELGRKTGARILHADARLPYVYGEPAEEGRTVRIGGLTIRPILTPGHTTGHMSYLLSDPTGAPWVLFSGDTLFAGDIGRVDLLGMDRAEELAGLLYDSIVGKILPLGDHVILCPAHGSGSVCAADIAERSLTTIGLERLHNPKLRFENRASFVAANARELERPPYFLMMERLNLESPPVLDTLPTPAVLSPDLFEKMMGASLVLDTRMELSFASAHIPGALSIWEAGLPSFAGWFLDYDRPILLVTETPETSRTVRYLVRLGFDRIAGTLAGGMLGWHMAGKNSARVNTVTAEDISCSLDEGGLRADRPFILDVRSLRELETAGRISGAHHIHITALPLRLDEVPKERPVFIFCGSGLRSTIAASLLERAGYPRPTVILGGLSGWKSASCPVEK
ncbi:MAG: MBL fold metallo-hydrolase [Deltaproteobacteria bacterium]|nr:MBL fold metallo-hydrolase [Candidatus Zymogenaceae bacterium]